MGDDTKLVIARSLDDARVGEVVPIDKEGNVPVAGSVWPYRLGICAVFAVLGWGLYYTWGSWLMLVLAVALLALLRWFSTSVLRLHNAMALVAAHRDGEAEAVLTQQRWSRSFHAQRDKMQATLAWRRGDHARALQLLDGAIAAMRGGRGYVATQTAMCRCDRARLLVIMGRGGEVPPGELDDVPHGEWFVASRRELELARAFHAGDATALPDHDTLHEWARAALMRSQYISALGYLAWAFDARGDTQMARHLLAEAHERQQESPERYDPRLREWLAARA